MVDTVKDKEGRVIALCEWSLRDEEGNEKKDGEYIFFNYMWVHPDFRHNGMWSKFRKLIEPKVPSARFLYFERKKYNKNGKDRLSCYTEKQILKLKGV
tara:strand:+ start:89 stop:382 length:294 start_codon:yes stop_codon:yes gene_type:complete